MRFSLYLISAFILISCVSAHNRYHHHPRPHNSKPRLNDLQNDLLNFGINFIFQKAADKYGVADNDVQVTRINNFGTRVWNNDWTVYWFNVDATNNNDDTVRARFGVEYNHETGERNMGKWRYNIHYYDDNDNGNTGVNANEENQAEGILNEENALGENELGFDEGGADLEAESESEFEVEIEIEVGVGEESIDNSDTDYEDVPQDQIQNDPVINNALLYGAEFIFNRAAENFGLSDNGIQVTDVESLQRRNAGDDHTRYRAHVQATNDEDVTVDASFIVDVNNQNQDMAVVGPWRYTILSNANEENGNFEEESILEFALL